MYTLEDIIKIGLWKLGCGQDSPSSGQVSVESFMIATITIEVPRRREIPVFEKDLVQ